MNIWDFLIWADVPAPQYHPPDLEILCCGVARWEQLASNEPLVTQARRLLSLKLELI
jgi:hypothetical protein